MATQEEKKILRAELKRRARLKREQQEQEERSWMDDASDSISEFADDASGIARTVGQGVTFGFGDEIEAGFRTGFGYLGDRPYTEVRDEIRKDVTDYTQRNPKTAMALETVGGLLVPGLGGLKAAQMAGRGVRGLQNLSTKGKMGYGAVQGAGEGALAGAGYSTEEGGGGIVMDALKGAGAGGVLGGAVGGIAGKLADRAKNKQELMRDINSGDPTVRSTAGYEVGESRFSNTPTVKKDKIARKAMDTGWQEGVVGDIKKATPETKVGIKQMLNDKMKGTRSADYATKNRPEKVIGEEIKTRIDDALVYKNEAGRAVSEAVDNLSTTGSVNTAPVLDPLVASLDDIGVKIDPNTGLLDFEGSAFEGMGSAQKPFELAMKRVVGRNDDGTWKDVSPKELHQLKQLIDEQVDYGKRGEGLTGKAEKMLKETRHNINELLKGLSPEYAEANKKYSDVIRVLHQVNDATGSKVNVFSPDAAKLGLESRKILSNYGTKPEMDEAFIALDGFLGGKGHQYPKDVTTLVNFNKELANRFGANAPSSLQGEVATGTLNAVETALDAGTGGIPGMIRAAKKVVGGGKPTNDDAYESMMNLLRRQRD